MILNKKRYKKISFKDLNISRGSVKMLNMKRSLVELDL